MFADFRLKLFWNAYLPIFDTWSRFISVSHSHALNAKLPSESTEAGKFTDVNLQPANAFSPIYVNESGKIIDVKPQLTKIEFPMDFIALGMFMEVSL